MQGLPTLKRATGNSSQKGEKQAVEFNAVRNCRMRGTASLTVRFFAPQACPLAWFLP